MSWARLLWTAMLLAQDPSTLKLDVQVVSVDVTVVDSKGNLFNQLGKDDFLLMLRRMLCPKTIIPSWMALCSFSPSYLGIMRSTG